MYLFSGCKTKVINKPDLTADKHRLNLQDSLDGRDTIKLSLLCVPGPPDVIKRYKNNMNTVFSIQAKGGI